MLFIFTAAALARIQWEKMNTEKQLILSCAVCNKVVRAIRNGTKIEPIPGSECAKPETQNQLCRFIEEVNATVGELFKDGRIPPNPCAIMGPCVPVNVSGKCGTFCYPCRLLSSQLFYVPKGQRREYLTSFCASTRAGLAEFCSFLEDGKVDMFLKSMERAKNPNQLCDNIKFCHSVNSGFAGRRSGRVIFKKREEL